MYALCNSDAYDGRYDSFQEDFIHSLDLHHRHLFKEP
jgi:hypothetical protein